MDLLFKISIYFFFFSVGFYILTWTISKIVNFYRFKKYGTKSKSTISDESGDDELGSSDNGRDV